MLIPELLKQASFYEDLCIKLAGNDSLFEEKILRELSKLNATLGKPLIALSDFKIWYDLNKSALSAAKINNLFFSEGLIWFRPAEKYEGVISPNSDLSKDSYFSDEESYKLIYEAKLTGYQSIPDLWLFVVKYIYDQYQSNIFESFTPSKEMADYSKLLSIISEMLNMSRAKDIVEFYNTYKDNLKKIRDISGAQPKFLGGGADGRAYDIGNNMVLKLFLEEYSFESAKKALETPYTDPKAARTEARIYDAGIVGSYKGEKLYYLLIEKMNKIADRHDMRDLLYGIVKNINKFHTIVDPLRNKFTQESKLEDKDYAEINEIVQKISSEITIDKSRYKLDVIKKLNNLKDNWLPLFIEEIIMKYISRRGDLHTGNLGVTNFGELRYFDPAHPSHQVAINY